MEEEGVAVGVGVASEEERPWQAARSRSARRAGRGSTRGKESNGEAGASRGTDGSRACPTTTWPCVKVALSG